MGRVRPSFWRKLTLLLVIIGPLLTACEAPITPPPLDATSGKPLVEAIEAYMSSLPGASPKLFLTTRVYDRHGVLLGEFWDEGRRYWVSLDQIAPAVRQATVATEDRTFYANDGVDWPAIARAVLQNTQQQQTFSGASTITQQVARNIAFPYHKRIEQSLDRKVNEAVLAQDLTQRFTKNQILEMYLNVVYYGHLAYGIEAAALTYFGKSAADLTLAESTLLAALPQAPAELDPLVPGNLDAVKVRQGIVLALMVRNRYLPEDKAKATFEEPLHFRSAEPVRLAPHFLDYVKERVESEHEGPIGRLGLSITTTLDWQVQQVAEDIVRKQVAGLREKYNLTNAAMVAMKPASGEIIAMVGGINYDGKETGSQVNVTIRPRQPGSAIKPILYSLAFTRGYGPADVTWDVSTEFKLDQVRSYRPVNYDGKYHGPVRLRQALANSYNIPAVNLLHAMGVPDMVQMAHAMGIQGLNNPVEQYGLSLTLGGAEVTLLSLTNAYATLANGGWRLPPTPILAESDSGGQIVRHDPAAAAVVDPRVAYLVTSILSDNDARLPMFGPNSPLRLSRPVAAKTGTTTDWRDNWTVGYTPYLAVGVWAGNSDGSPMRNTTGLTGAAPIWHDFYEAVFARPELEAAIREPGESIEFQRPPGLVEAPICVLSSLKWGSACPQQLTELFIDPAQPVTIGLNGVRPITPTITAGVDGRLVPVDPAWSIRHVSRSGGRLCSRRDGTGETIAMIRVPNNLADANRAWRWANAAGIPAEPPECGGQLALDYIEAPPPSIASAVTDYQPVTNPTGDGRLYIASPQPGATVRGVVNIVGSAVFSSSEYQFYKVEFGYGSNPGEWITMGDAHRRAVTNAWLETWHANSLPQGRYVLRVVLVKSDGNYTTSAATIVDVVR